ncbi:RidA family protein [Gordonia hydrophobica]|uniref:RidA family protein n=1 Tax=Gordonia hydrophobica TaxID=40516 RepID=A0ABZ2U738_9ACTN|nr:RidA family protein [Gordonia hydrophobica]MBM7367962.1 enamine deaminase RidA (YjgF/YER057c/UK114 family) [Gordonia hydrophobica]
MSGAVDRFGSAALHDGGFAYGARIASNSLIVTAGLSPLDADGQIVGPDDPVAQMTRTVQCLDEILAEQRAQRADIAKLTTYVATTDHAVIGAAWQALDAAFDGAAPPAIVVGVTVLPYPRQLVEIEAIIATGPVR